MLQTQQLDLADKHAAQRIALTSVTTALVDDAWQRVDPDHIVASWTEQLPVVTAATTRAQYQAASTSDGFIDSFDMAGAGVEDDLDPTAFAGEASDGRGLVGLLMSPAFQVLQLIGGGLLTSDAMSVGGQHLGTIVRTQVADAGRVADGVALTAHRRLDGYVRVVAGGACSRCAVLSGRWYRWNQGFQRHPNCHCVHAPSHRDIDIPSPKEYYDRLSPAERRRAGWTEADQRAIADGGDIFAVTNAHRGVYEAGGQKLTTEGTTRRGAFGGYRVDDDGTLRRRARGEKVPKRLTPEQIYAEAGDDRGRAIRLLRENAYLKPTTVRGAATRERFELAAVETPTDPALKMTVAQLKKAAKDANVPLFGATRKADIVRSLRSWERTYVIKIDGLPLWKEPPPPGWRPPAPPLGKPDPGVVLTNPNSYDWPAELMYKIGPRADTPAEGYAVRDLRVAESQGREYIVTHGTVWRFDRVQFLIEHPPSDAGSAWVSRVLRDLREAHGAIPAAGEANRAYAFLSGRSPNDAYWQIKFKNPNHVAAMTAGRGNVWIWNQQPPFGRVQVDLLRHETGHNLEDQIGHFAEGSESPQWIAAADRDVAAARKVTDFQPSQYEIKASDLGTVEPGRGWPKGVTAYGRSSAREDFAESVMLYQVGALGQGRLTPRGELGPIYFRDIYPGRAKVLDGLFPELAKAQKAEIAALRSSAKPHKAAPKKAAAADSDLAKRTVVQLRAMAKEQGVRIPGGVSRARKAELIDALEKAAADAKKATRRRR